MNKSLEDMIRDPEYWNGTFDKLINKENISAENKYKLAKCYTLYRDKIVDQLITGEYTWSIPRKVQIRKSETNRYRTVYIYDIEDRLILGVLYHVLSDYFKDRVSDLCYSYKKGCNTIKAISYIKDYKTDEYQYGVKVDIHAYFNNISENRLHQMLDELFLESTGLKKSIEKVMYDNRCEYLGNIIPEYKGVIPGTPIASFFANYCLRECDYYFESKGSIYARYSDDIIILENSDEEVKADLSIIKRYLEDYGLKLNPSKYTYFRPGDDVVFLGLKLGTDGTIDMSDHSKEKVKKQIHRWCRKGRKEIELWHTDFMTMAKKINRRINTKNFKCYIKHENSFGWCHYMFRYITTDKSLKELDEYTKNTLRAMKTGKHNKANYKAITEEEFREMGWVSITQLYHLYKKDFEYYCEMIYLF